MLRKAVPIFSHTFCPRRNIVRDCARGSIAESTLRSATEGGRLQSRELSRARPGGARVTGCDSPPPLYTKATRRYRWVSARVSVFPVPIWKKPRDPRIPAGDETTSERDETDVMLDPRESDRNEGRIREGSWDPMLMLPRQNPALHAVLCR